MPELPEVETIRRQLESIIGSTITSVEFTPSKVIRGEMSTILHEKILSIERYGKLLVIRLSNNRALTVHLKMTGRLSLLETGDEVPGYNHISFHLTPALSSDRRGSLFLVYCDMRKFGFVALHTKEEIISLPFIRNLGKEPLKDLTLQDFQNLLSRSNRAIKVLLLDQSKIAGIGNIYDCEALWLAGIRPQRRANSLQQTEIRKLFIAIEDVLREGIKRGGASDNTYRNLYGGKGEYQNFFKVYGRTGKPCPRCGTLIVRESLGGRGTFFCPHCQK